MLRIRAFAKCRIYELNTIEYGKNQTNSVTELSRISLYNVSEGDKTLHQ